MYIKKDPAIYLTLVIIKNNIALHKLYSSLMIKKRFSTDKKYTPLTLRNVNITMFYLSHILKNKIPLS